MLLSGKVRSCLEHHMSAWTAAEVTEELSLLRRQAVGKLMNRAPLCEEVLLRTGISYTARAVTSAPQGIQTPCVHTAREEPRGNCHGTTEYHTGSVWFIFPVGFGLVRSTPALSLRVHGVGRLIQGSLSSAVLCPCRGGSCVQCSPSWVAPLDPHVLWQSPPGTLCPSSACGRVSVLS